jgi:CHU_C Type IX secretion signal domain
MGAAKVKSLANYDRWGTKVFDKHDFFPSDRSQCWDGTVKGLPSAAGTYVYFVELECRPGETITRKGSLVLLR